MFDQAIADKNKASVKAFFSALEDTNIKKVLELFTKEGKQVSQVSHQDAHRVLYIFLPLLS